MVCFNIRGCFFLSRIISYRNLFFQKVVADAAADDAAFIKVQIFAPWGK